MLSKNVPTVLLMTHMGNKEITGDSIGGRTTILDLCYGSGYQVVYRLRLRKNTIFAECLPTVLLPIVIPLPEINHMHKLIRATRGQGVVHFRGCVPYSAAQEGSHLDAVWLCSSGAWLWGPEFTAPLVITRAAPCTAMAEDALAQLHSATSIEYCVSKHSLALYLCFAAPVCCAAPSGR